MTPCDSRRPTLPTTAGLSNSEPPLPPLPSPHTPAISCMYVGRALASEDSAASLAATSSLAATAAGMLHVCGCAWGPGNSCWSGVPVRARAVSAALSASSFEQARKTRPHGRLVPGTDRHGSCTLPSPRAPPPHRPIPIPAHTPSHTPTPTHMHADPNGPHDPIKPTHAGRLSGLDSISASVCGPRRSCSSSESSVSSSAPAFRDSCSSALFRDSIAARVDG